MALRLTAETIDSGVVSGTLSRKIVGEVEISSRARGNSTWRSALLCRRFTWSFGPRRALYARYPNPIGLRRVERSSRSRLTLRVHHGHTRFAVGQTGAEDGDFVDGFALEDVGELGAG